MKTSAESLGLEKLLAAVERLCNDAGGEECFFLIAADIPEFPVFYGGTQGGGYMLMDKETTMYVDVPLALIERDVLRGVKHLPVAVENKQTLVNYPDSLWDFVAEAMQAYVLTDGDLDEFYGRYETVEEVDPAKRMVLEIPRGDAAFFLRTLVEQAWGLPPAEFRYQLAWAEV